MTTNIESKNIFKSKTYIEDNYIKYLSEDTILFNGKVSKKYNRANSYQTKDNIIRIIYKFINYRKYEKFRNGISNKTYCNATIIYTLPNQNKKHGYYFKIDHSEECNNLNILYNVDNKNNNNNKENSKKEFIELCEKFMNSSSIYDRTLYKNEFKNIYNSNIYKFELTDNFLSNIINNWRTKSNKFKKISVLENQFDYKNRLILREFRNIYIEIPKKENAVLLDYIIWGNNENISRIRLAKTLYLDGTYHHPVEYKQLLILMYRDVLTNLNIPGIFILLNGKHERFYEIVLLSVKNIITQNDNFTISAKIMVTDAEKALRNATKKLFPNMMHLTCYFHYIQDLVRNIKSYGLYKKDNKKISDKIIKKLSLLPIYYKGDMNYIYNKLNEIKVDYRNYENFINNYFIKNKIEFFEDQSLNYDNVPKESRTNNFLENYNGYLKIQLGKKRIINWVNFLHFIKNESDRSINKLLNKANYNKIYFEKKEKYKNEKLELENKESKENSYIKYSTKETLKSENKINQNNLLYLEFLETGIINFSNNCFANSIIQVLLHYDIFMQKFLKYISKEENDSKIIV